MGFHPEALEELAAAVEFYESERVGLGRELILEVRAVLERLSDWPLSGSRETTEVRRHFSRAFPSRSSTGSTPLDSMWWPSCTSAGSPAIGARGPGPSESRSRRTGVSAAALHPGLEKGVPPPRITELQAPVDTVRGCGSRTASRAKST